MRRLISLLLVSAVVLYSAPVHPEEEYDPQHTILALNMAIVSINKIVTAQDRLTLDQEYSTIINKLALGNIESDYEMTGLYAELMNFITGKGLRQEEAKRFQERYNRREQRQIVDALSGIRAYGGNLWSWLGSLATSCVSSYFSYQSSKAELLEGLNDDLWQLKKEEIEDCNELQVRLLNSSWNLLRQYKLPDEYRLTQESLNGYYKAVNESDPSKRLRMLRARNVERNFQVYPPYWYYRAKAAQESGDDSEALKCWDKFAEVWRPVLRNDPYKLEEAKYRVQRLAANSEANREEIRRLLVVIQDNISAGDWSNNLFAGVAYFLMGDKDEGIACVEVNVDFAYENNISKAILAEMKNGELNALTLYALKEDIKIAPESPRTKQPAKSAASFTGEIKDKQLSEALINLFEGKEEEAEKALESMIETSENPVVFFVLHFMNETKNYHKAQLLWNYAFSILGKNNEEANTEAFIDVSPLLVFYADKGVPFAQHCLGWTYIMSENDAEAFKWFRKAAEQGHAGAQLNLGTMYGNGDGVSKNDKESVKWFHRAAEQGNVLAQYILGLQYGIDSGGVERDCNESYMWLYLAYLNGYTDASEKLKDLEKEGWFSSAAVSKSEAEAAKEKARRKYNEIRKRNGLE